MDCLQRRFETYDEKLQYYLSFGQTGTGEYNAQAAVEYYAAQKADVEQEILDAGGVPRATTIGEDRDVAGRTALGPSDPESGNEGPFEVSPLIPDSSSSPPENNGGPVLVPLSPFSDQWLQSLGLTGTSICAKKTPEGRVTNCPR